MSATTNKGWEEKICLRLERLQEVRTAEISREQELIRHRKSVKNELLKLGPGRTPAHLNLGLDFAMVLFKIEHCRDHQRTLNDKIGESISKARQPELWDFDDEDEIVSRDPSDQELFDALAPSKKPRETDGDDDADQLGLDGKPINPRAKGQPGRVKPAAHVQAEGVDEHLNASVKELQLEDSLTNKLIGLGYERIGQLAKAIDEGVELEGKDVSGLSGPQAKKVRAAVEKFRKAHRKAMAESN